MQPLYYQNKLDSVHSEYLLNPVLINYLQAYFELRFYNKRVTTPYFINTKRRKDLRALVGKGTPTEIIIETKVWAQVKGLNLRHAKPEEIRDLMLKVGIGIDCSGLIVHAFNHYYQSIDAKSLYKRVKYETNGLRAKLARFFRPAENLSANTLTSELNCERLDLHAVRPGDFIRGVGKQRNAYHIALVTKVNTELKADGEYVKQIEYVHSHRAYGDANGMRRGVVKVVKPQAGILQQMWIDNHSDGINYFFESDLKPNPQDSGFRRLRQLNP